LQTAAALKKTSCESSPVLQTPPKGSSATHWTIKKVYSDIWQLDLPDGYRLEYTVVDTDRVVLVLFIGNHDDAAAYLRGKK
jgi:mRNA-degrading endonuclease RelE of RelBE toxin-antitoxin system